MNNSFENLNINNNEEAAKKIDEKAFKEKLDSYMDFIKKLENFDEQLDNIEKNIEEIEKKIKLLDIEKDKDLIIAGFDKIGALENYKMKLLKEKKLQRQSN